MKLFPNPASHLLQVEWAEVGTPAELRLMDLQGQVVLVQRGQGGTAEMDVSGLARGMYVLRLSVGGRWAVGRVMVE